MIAPARSSRSPVPWLLLGCLLASCTDSTSSGQIPSQLEFTIQPAGTTAGVTIGPAVAVAIEDAGGNTITSATQEVTLALGANASGGSLSGTLTAAAVNGVATFPNLRIARAGGGYTLKATTQGLPAVESRVFDIAAGPAAALQFTGQPTNAMTGSAIAPRIEVTAQDSVGNVAVGFNAMVTVALSGSPAPGTLVGTTAVTADHGVATFSDLAIGQVGLGYRLTASAGGLTTATSAPFSVGPPTATLRVTATTSGALFDPDGYVVCVDNDPYNSGCGLSSAISVNGTVAIIADTGAHTILLTGVAANCTVAGVNPRTIHAAPGGTVTIQFTVTCAAGTLRITTSTTGASFDPHGSYHLCVDPDYYYGCDTYDAAIGVNGSVSMAVQTSGSHTLELDGVPFNCVVSGDDPRTVTVAGNLDVLFTVTCISAGSVRVTAATSGADLDPDGYTICLDRIASGCIQLVQVAANGLAAFSFVPAGSHTVTLTSLAENCSVSGAATRAVTVPADASVDVGFDVQCTMAERLAFSTGGELTIMRVDGSALLSLVPGLAPAWSPDGARLAYVCAQDICTINADGTGMSRLTFDAAGNDHPTWSPDGTRIVFAATHAGVTDLYLMGADGSGVTRLTQGFGIVGSPAWSPDGTRVAFDCQVNPGNADICAVNPDGTGFARLTTDPASDVGPAWKPDGSMLAFATTRYGVQEIALLDPAGGSVTRLGVPGFEPTWSPDGARLALVQTYTGYYGDASDYITVAGADGSNVHSITLGDQPAWKPHP